MLRTAGIRVIQRYDINDGIASDNRELPSTEPTLVFNTGSPIEIIDAHGEVLRVASGEGFFAGLQRRFCLSRCFGSQTGFHVRLSAGAAFRLLGPTAAECTGRVQRLDDVLNGQFQKAINRFGPVSGNTRLTELVQLMRCALRDTRNPRSEVLWVLDQLSRGSPRIAALANQLGWSRRKLINEFCSVTGLSPKVFARIARFQRVVADIQHGGGVAWADIAIREGYFDQSHMIRDFGEFAGTSPGAYLTRR